MDAVTGELGKREAHKAATREAIQDAADRLFGAQGYAHTTVRDIADAAGVTERTFFRYFSGKESLLVKDIETWLPALGDEIRRRPSDEEPLEAVERAFHALWQRIVADDRLNLTWLFHDGPPGPKLEKSAPGLLLRFETTVADALDARGGGDTFTNQVLARCAVAALRSAGIRNWQLGRSTSESRPGRAELIAEAFDVLRRAR